MTVMDLHPAAAATPHPAPDDEQLLASARRALAIEARAVEALTARLGTAFAQACRVCLACHGRVVVTGMGKSGHVAGKIAATLASTGTPAFFLHPAEAGHGDLGMITRQDAVLALSNSGETPELVLLLPHLKRLGVPLIVMTGKSESTLGRAASVTLDVGVPEEACPLNLAPTASTTATLAMGDALAVAVLEARGFTRQDFARSHPGGALGRKLLLPVEALMRHGAAGPRAHADRHPPAGAGRGRRAHRRTAVLRRARGGAQGVSRARRARHRAIASRRGAGRGDLGQALAHGGRALSRTGRAPRAPGSDRQADRPGAPVRAPGS